MEKERLIHTLKELYNYMEDRANEEQKNEEYHFLFKIHGALASLGAGSPEDDKFGIAGKEAPRRYSAFSSVDDVFNTIDPEGDRFKMNDFSNRPELNESISRIKKIMGLNESMGDIHQTEPDATATDVFDVNEEDEEEDSED